MVHIRGVTLNGGLMGFDGGLYTLDGGIISIRTLLYCCTLACHVMNYHNLSLYLLSHRLLVVS